VVEPAPTPRPARVQTLRLHGPGDLRLHDEGPPQAGEGEAVLRVTAVGLCGSDLHWYEEGGIGDTRLTTPLVLGHEFAGVIESGARAGERVAVDPAIACGGCSPCLAGDHNLCVASRFAGVGTTDGALRGCLAWPEELMHGIPDEISDEEAPLLETLGVALHAVDLGHVQSGMSAGVYGCGPVGLLVVQLLSALGIAPIVASDPLPHRSAAAEAMGASITGDPEAVAAEQRQVDVVFEASGEDAAVAMAVGTIRPGGRIVLVGIPSDDTTSFTAGVARRKGLTFSLCRRMKPRDLPRAIRLATAGRVDFRGLLSERFPLSEGPAAFEALASRRGLKVVVEP
jgi:L-iditol 2-dehydrogenase